MMGDWDGGMGVGWLLMMVFWVVLLAAVVWAVASLFPAHRDVSAVPPERAEDVLDRRLARGEIDAATYDELRGKLRAARAERV
jgi:putative membrane protein